MQETIPNHPETPEQRVARLDGIIEEGNKYPYKARLTPTLTEGLEPIGWTLYKFDPNPRSNAVTANKRKLLAEFWSLIIARAVPVTPLTYRKVAEVAERIMKEDSECDKELAEEIALGNCYRELIAELTKQLVIRGMDSQEALVLAIEISGGYTAADVRKKAQEILPVYYDTVLNSIRNRGKSALQKYDEN